MSFRNCFGKSPASISKVRRVLIMELWGIGDVVLASGVLQLLKGSYSSLEITLLAKRHSKDILLNNKCVDKFVFFDFPWTKFKRKYNFLKWDFANLFKLICELRKEKFDLVLDARGDFRNNLFSFLINAKWRVGYNWTGGGYFLTDVLKCDYRNLHRVDAWANLIKHVGIKYSDIKPVIKISEEEKRWANEFLKGKGLNKKKLLIGIHPGARIKTRCWPLERFSKVASYLIQGDIQVIIFIEPDGYGQDMQVLDGCIKVKVNLRDFMSLAKELDFLVCNDGGAMHIAVAVHTPVVALFGPMNPMWFGPYGEGNTIVIRENVSCRPCFDYCKHKEPYCLTSITEEQVIKQIDVMIRKMRKIKDNHVGAKVI